MSDNRIKIEFLAMSENEAFARIAVSGAVAALDPTIDDLADIKTAVSEAVTNSIIHGYANDISKIITMEINISEFGVEIIIADKGVGIEDIEEAKEPLFTSKPELERSGMGFTVMETFMDEVIVESEKEVGTKVIMRKKLKKVE
ncbi:MAG: anti-sigma F factor [Sarcina sp.]